MISLESFSQLLQILYSAPLQDERWEEFLTLICEITHSKGGFFLCADSQLGLSIRAQGGGMVMDSTDLIAYREVYAPKDPLRTPAILSGKTGVVDCEELLPLEELHKSELFREMVLPRGLYHPSLIMLTCSIRRFEAISFWRTPEEGKMDEESNRLLHLLVPHIQAALRIRQVLGVTEQRLKSAEAMANASETPTFILSAKGTIRMSNTAAESLLHAGDGLINRDGVLVATHRKSQAELERLLRRMSSTSFSHLDPQALRPMLLHRASGAQPLILQTSPLPSTAPFGEHSVLLLVTDPDRPANPSDEVLRSLYDLTAAEIEVATGLVTGYSLREIASLRQVAIGTVRGQIKSVFAKTGTSSQSDLVRLLTGLPRGSTAN
jgi:DNA-binding CsgD family transcriptional regulator